jgi:hypothetical protein
LGRSLHSATPADALPPGTDAPPWPPADPKWPPAAALPQAATATKAPAAIVASAAWLAAPVGHIRRTISLTSTTGGTSRATLEEVPRHRLAEKIHQPGSYRPPRSGCSARQGKGYLQGLAAGVLAKLWMRVSKP